MIKIVVLSLLFGTIPFIVKYITLEINHLISENKLYKKIDIINEIYSFIIFSLISFIFFFLLYSYSNESKITVIIITYLFIFMFTTSNYLIMPFIILFRNEKYINNKKIEKFINDIGYDNINVKIINDDHLINAFATGILPFSQTILLGLPLINKMAQCDIKNILFHELGHVKQHHLLILYIVTLTYAIFWVLSFTIIIPYLKIFSNQGANVALLSGILGTFQIWIIGLSQKKLEYKADTFAASLVGGKAYSETLKNLDAVTDGKMRRFSWTHPTLSQRIEHIINIEVSRE